MAEENFIQICPDCGQEIDSRRAEAHKGVCPKYQGNSTVSLFPIKIVSDKLIPDSVRNSYTSRDGRRE